MCAFHDCMKTYVSSISWMRYTKEETRWERVVHKVVKSFLYNFNVFRLRFYVTWVKGVFWSSRWRKRLKRLKLHHHSIHFRCFFSLLFTTYMNYIKYPTTHEKNHYFHSLAVTFTQSRSSFVCVRRKYTSFPII